jgi:hypothetical protein
LLKSPAVIVEWRQYYFTESKEGAPEDKRQ